MLTTMKAVLFALRILTVLEEDECGGQSIQWPANPAAEELRRELSSDDDGSDITL
jgi:hypothetical protein